MNQINESISECEPFSKEELNNRISQSENDFRNRNYKTTSELLDKY